eukprot:Blabericola_migrator_1__12965@NODE_859_length_6239_cov_134_489469_g609_i0_p1_GENE_NODE_859_length_6239_cov_134_489469_g609_i0NODE_859_length_6239_cov_134_489469_g609_i0_p1_ORF_typecomplete_len896_score169_67Radical_SAM/PF04055_21/4_4e24Radical_SAM_C/PF16199_5/3_4e22Acetyltransf_1/PF00583_25/1_2e03Acetyltransf_1/PF00583_25/1e06Acetyltransf_10/PF13673_7/0_00016Acetyltransf_9/PF13527_7/6e03Acetyltransf_9/PF13527_7/0_16_NODE_859_length_6239_cov_134_489469_g609_i021614848
MADKTDKRLTRDLMFDAVPYSSVRSLLILAISSRGLMMREIIEVPLPLALSSVLISRFIFHCSMLASATSAPSPPTAIFVGRQKFWELSGPGKSDLMSAGPLKTEPGAEDPLEDEMVTTTGSAANHSTFFPANMEDFIERAGVVAKVTEKDFDDEHKRRHLESFKESMEAWRNYENKLGQQKEDAVLSAFVDDLIEVEHLIHSAADLDKQLKPLRRKHRIGPSKQDIAVVLRTKGPRDGKLESILIKRQVRTSSGVAVITVLTSPGKFSCPKNCFYCPDEPGQPRSYLSTEPAVLRGNQNGWDPARQFWDRAKTLTKNGHIVDKIELLVLGGTWSGYSHDYQEEFVRDLFYAANEYYDWLDKIDKMDEQCNVPIPDDMRPRSTLAEEQKINETSRCKVIGLTLETRPDYINKYELLRLRAYGCTRVQLGVQHTDDTILKYINRGCTTADAVKAIRRLKDSCFKVDIHLMPDLPGSTLEKDAIMFDNVLRNPGLQADQWKIYPCEVTPFSQIAQWYADGEYKPYTETLGEDKLLSLILQVKRLVHPWIRLNRVVRDIPNQSIIAGNSKTNLRQLLEFASSRMGWKCRCMRCREIRTLLITEKGVLRVRSYTTVGGEELFISYESSDGKSLFGFLRLRLPDLVKDSASEESPFKVLQGRCALVRELHVYGLLVATTEQKGEEDTRYQHSGYGRQLIIAAEAIAMMKGYERVAIIAGIGTRGYYAKWGYDLRETYMVKDIDTAEAMQQVVERWKQAPQIPRVLTISHLQWEYYPSVARVNVDQDIVTSVLSVAAKGTLKGLTKHERKVIKEQQAAEAAKGVVESAVLDRLIEASSTISTITRPNTLGEPEELEEVQETVEPEKWKAQIVKWVTPQNALIATAAVAILVGVWLRRRRSH